MRLKKRLKTTTNPLILFVLLISLLLVYLPNQLTAQKNLEVKAEKGATVTSLLSKYLLHEYGCNLEAFKKLNKGTTGVLKEGVKYKMPIKVYTYNGKSIRTTIGIKDYQKAKRIQAYNEQLVRNKVKAGDYRQDKVLWVPQHEVYCKKTNVKPPTSYGRIFPIFGLEYQYVPKQSDKLKGKVYYIVSGHGGPDPGAVFRQNGKKYCEDEYAYDIALRLARNLIAHGATTYMIIRDPNDGIRSGSYLPIDKEEYCWRNQKIPYDQKARLKQRSDAINKLYAYHKKKGVKDSDQQTIVLHIDSRRANKRIDVFFYHQAKSATGKKLATTLLSTVKQKYAEVQKGRTYAGTVKTRDLFMLRETKTTTVYIELGNIKNPADQQRFFVENNRQALANWLFAGLVKAAK